MDELSLDLAHLRCPLPIVKLNGAMRTLAAGATLTVFATDPAFEPDVQAWCRRTGNALLELRADRSGVTARIRKGA